MPFFLTKDIQKGTGLFMNEKFFDLKKEKQDRMINAALKIFAENGFRKASTDEMVKEAGISKGLLFHYFVSKAGLYEFVCDYSVKFIMMEIGSAVDEKESDYFELRRQIERAKSAAMKNFPYMQMFLLQAKKEDAVGSAKEILQTLDTAYDNICRRADFGYLESPSKERLVCIVEYTLNGLLAQMLEGGTFTPEDYLKEALAYLGELENLYIRRETASPSPF